MFMNSASSIFSGKDRLHILEKKRELSGTWTRFVEKDAVG